MIDIVKLINENEPKTIKLIQTLPDGYTRMKYIESTGTQYIDTGFKLTGNSKVIFKFSTENTKSQHIFGTSDFRFYTQNHENAFYEFVYPNGYWHEIGNYNTDINTLELSGYGMYINGTKVTPYNTQIKKSTFTEQYSTPIFARNKGGTITSYSSVELYHFKIYDNNTLVRNYIPAKRNSDNELGLYDLVENKFYTNQGTGSFIGEEYTYDNVAKVVYNGTTIWEGVPSEYKQLEYIESTGAQYIDTNVENTGTMVVDFIASITKTNDQQGIFGATGTIQWNSQLRLYTGKSGNINMLQYNYGNDTQISWDNPINNLDTTSKTKYTLGNGKFCFNDVTYVTYEVKSFSKSQTGLIFAVKDVSGQPSYLSKMKLYSLKIKDRNNLVRNYIPAKRILDDEIGLYDTVTKEFYTNAGTGTFIAGEEID